MGCPQEGFWGAVESQAGEREPGVEQGGETLKQKHSNTDFSQPATEGLRFIRVSQSVDVCNWTVPC